ncbi:hypothetical protein FQN60_013199 [Etheostoma spectabile]|uniref:Peptidase C1A papain C-terminal domain-containing protein n=1 Tax=Etheostoma spectabile TaxID=54343 RepID=A0A5J5D8W4_9PERO|nr:hypothetical protein FQN60_013199 [Etheostoma spectabile]
MGYVTRERPGYCGSCWPSDYGAIGEKYTRGQVSRIVEVNKNLVDLPPDRGTYGLQRCGMSVALNVDTHPLYAADLQAPISRLVVSAKGDEQARLMPWQYGSNHSSLDADHSASLFYTLGYGSDGGPRLWIIKNSW